MERRAFAAAVGRILVAVALMVATVATASAAEIVMCNGLEATMVGTEGNDVLRATSGDDVIAGLGGDDTIVGKNGNDVMCGGDGNDVIWTWGGADIAFGGPGDDFIDNGIGLPCDAERSRPGHLGVVGMRERALAIGARFSMHSPPGGGASVQLDWEEA